MFLFGLMGCYFAYKMHQANDRGHRVIEGLEVRVKKGFRVRGACLAHNGRLAFPMFRKVEAQRPEVLLTGAVQRPLNE